MPDVIVTGYAAIAPAAMDAAALHARILGGQSCLRSHPRFEALGFPNSAAGFIDAAQWRRIDAALPAGSDPALGPRSRLALVLAHAALADAGLDPSTLADARCTLNLGANKFCAGLDDFDHAVSALQTDGRIGMDALLATPGPAESHPYRVDEPALALARALGLAQAPQVHSDACAAGSIAIGSGYRAILEGRADIALCGAVELLANELPYFMFHSLGALCDRAELAPHAQSRPFTRDRAGLVLGEGAALLVLESPAHARRRGARLRGRVLGFDNRAEAQKITASDPAGEKYAECMAAALADADLDLDAVDHVNAHGTSTRLNDACEAAALGRLFGPRLARISLTANKSALGHSLAAGGALEAVLSLVAMERGEVLPTLNCSAADLEYPTLGLSDQPRRQSIRHALSNSFGFGGQNSCLVLGRAA